jgi:hypothetical protein
MKLATVVRLCCVLVAATFLAAPALAEKIPNPAYEQWSKFKPGAFATYENETVAMGNTTKMEITMKLVELTPEKAVIETSTKMHMGGQVMEMPGQKSDIPAMMEKVEMPAGQELPAGETTEGTATIEAAGKSFNCKTVTTVMTMGETKTRSEVWTSDEVPGGLVKLTATTEGAMSSSSTQILKAFSTGD